MKHNNTVFKDHFPALRKSTYFNTGSEGLLPRDTYYIMSKLLKRMFKYGASHPDYFSYINMYNNKLKEILKSMGLDPDDIIKVNSISEGLNFALNMQKLKKEDKVLVLKKDFKTVILAAKAAEKRFDIKIIWADNIDDMKKKIDEDNIKVVLISHVRYQDGKINDIDSVYDRCQENDTIMIIDGAQSFGNIIWDFKKKQAGDLYVWTTHKWGCSSRGLAYINVSERVKDKIYPLSLHYFSTKEFKAPDNIIFNENISDMSNHFTDFMGEISFVTTYRFLKKRFGFEYIQERKENLKNYFIEKIKECDYEVIPTHSSLISFRRPNYNNEEFVQRCYKNGFVLRTVPNTDYSRVSLHFYNTEKQIDNFIKKIKNFK